MDIRLVLVSLVHGLSVGLLNLLPNLYVEVLDLLCSLLGLPTKFVQSGDCNEVQGCPWVLSIHNLKRGKARGLAWCPVNLLSIFGLLR